MSDRTISTRLGKVCGLNDGRNPFARDMPQIAPALIQQARLDLVDIEARHGKTGQRKCLGQWQTYITQPDHTDSRSAVHEALLKFFFAIVFVVRHRFHPFCTQPRVIGQARRAVNETVNPVPGIDLRHQPRIANIVPAGDIKGDRRVYCTRAST